MLENASTAKDRLVNGADVNVPETLICVNCTVASIVSGGANDSPFQIRYAANLTSGDSVINITNTGANGASLNGPGFGGAAGNVCVNVYAFSPDEQLVSCCSCLITPNGLVSLSVNSDLISNTLTGVRPNSCQHRGWRCIHRYKLHQQCCACWFRCVPRLCWNVGIRDNGSCGTVGWHLRSNGNRFLPCNAQ